MPKSGYPICNYVKFVNILFFAGAAPPLHFCQGNSVGFLVKAKPPGWAASLE